MSKNFGVHKNPLSTLVFNLDNPTVSDDVAVKEFKKSITQIKLKTGDHEDQQFIKEMYYSFDPRDDWWLAPPVTIKDTDTYAQRQESNAEARLKHLSAHMTDLLVYHFE